MKYRREIVLAGACFLIAFLCSMTWLRTKDENLAERIAPEILRFHVLANSNSRPDQSIKIEVKTLLLEELESGMKDMSPDKAMVADYISDNHLELEEKAAAYIAAKGYDYGAHIVITKSYFPTKAYGDIVLPCGTYDTVQVTLGNGRGRNWWCLLYPQLCFVDSTHAVVPEESKQELLEIVGEDDYSALLDQRNASIKIAFKLWEMLIN